MTLPILLMILIFMFGAFLKGWSGFGTNLVVPPLLLFLTRFTNVKEVMVLVITVNLFLNLFMIVQSKRFNLRFLSEIWVLVATAFVFNFVGVYFTGIIEDTLFRILLGVAILLVTFNRIFKLRFEIQEITWKHYLITGVTSGVLNGLFGLGGIPLLILLSSTTIDRNKMKTTLVTYFFLMNIFYIFSQAILTNSYTPFVINNILIVFIFALIACALGVYFSSRVGDKTFQNVMNVVLILFGMNLIYVGLFGSHIFTIFS